MIEEKEIERIKRQVEEEFPEDPALQQVHIARKIIAAEAARGGMNFLEYIKKLVKKIRSHATSPPP